MSDKLTLALIGCGGMMGAHVAGYKELYDAKLRDFDIIACCDVDEARANAMAASIAEFQGRKPEVYSSVDALLGTEQGLMACDISVVHRQHHTVAIPCLEAGKHVTIEKPLGFTMRTGKMMLDAAGKAGVKFQVAENYRRDPTMRAIQWAVKSGRIGDVRMILWHDCGERLWYWTWREHKHQAGGGWPLDGGVHFADLFRYHIGPVVDVYCDTRQYTPFRYENANPLGGKQIPVDVEDTTFAMLRFEGDVLGSWLSTAAAPGGGFSKRIIYGSEGSLDFGEGIRSRTEEVAIAKLVDEYRLQLSCEDEARLFPACITNTVATELKEFVDACLLGTPIETDGLEGYKAEAICFALYESAWLRRPVTLAEVEALEVEGYQKELNESVGV